MKKYESQTNIHTLYQRIIKISEKFRPSNLNIGENLCALGLERVLRYEVESIDIVGLAVPGMQEELQK